MRFLAQEKHPPISTLKKTRRFTFYEQLIIKNVVYRTLPSIKSMKSSDCCASSLFGAHIKMRFIRPTLKDTQDEDNIFVLMKGLVKNQKKWLRSCFQVKIDTNDISIASNIYVRTWSYSPTLHCPSPLLKKKYIKLLTTKKHLRSLNILAWKKVVKYLFILQFIN